MTVILTDGALTAKADAFGAKLVSLRDADGREYVWQNKEDFWPDRAGVLFPTSGRLYGGCITYGGKKYDMPLHGFALTSTFTVAQRSERGVTFSLTSDEKTLAVYPFPFRLEVTYSLSGARLNVRQDVYNTGSEELYCAPGFHPWFNVPFDEKSGYDDCIVTFPNATDPKQCIMSDKVLDTGERIAAGGGFRLAHSLFSRDALMFEGTGDTVKLICEKTGKTMTIERYGLPYIGFWQIAHSHARLLCVEPMSALPGREGVTEDWSTRPSAIRVNAGGKASVGMSISIG